MIKRKKRRVKRKKNPVTVSESLYNRIKAFTDNLYGCKREARDLAVLFKTNIIGGHFRDLSEYLGVAVSNIEDEIA